MTAISVLDLVMMREGKNFSDSLNDITLLAKHAEQSGYNRYWIAEHHNMPGIASSATTIIMSHLASQTSSLRIGSGGIMMPNHSPLIIAEQLATLNTLFPGRIDLGLGRAPGTNSLTVKAIRGTNTITREFEDDVLTLQDYLLDNGNQPVRSIPEVQNIPIWILGSGLHGAELAAKMGLPFAFASHFAPFYLQQAVSHYKENFKPSAFLEKPYVMVGVNVFAADTYEEAQYLASSHRQWVVNRNSGRSGLLPKPVENYISKISKDQLHAMEAELAYTAIGSKEEVGIWLRRFINFSGADELMIDARIYDPVARCRSYQLAAESLNLT
ncbi:LLM class flavin-dependent oxidoreductase [Acinetobacter baumannii]|uniref:LLM class flavin-dependent oxidoreductase n=1 Tax=Acinetobacter baumannii TaxID=470 RepID=UPI001C0AE12D|nr:LLM class flavin-dependent oxidoreductase [Acinetobacter baumannii]MBU3167790.1 LLM class flavin-dependent oxidoreductase [Acinetobacter baumannii]MDC4399535.1 LLM class flavin-dependent oxidoreductase [Acinetobacter baumannii]MDC5381491.1 LLM class flavin-dependent oxidoreductase [Acinetobacter baumannii]MDK2106701.1 LLM class flavin-dependent oxidoreductase [Acinetobacter baumannii]MDK2112036.1 LLM class flavin-dependent oxidoreductase [Acinetobacter baumannii]